MSSTQGIFQSRRMGCIEMDIRSRAAGCLHSQHWGDWACHFHIKYPYTLHPNWRIFLWYLNIVLIKLFNQKSKTKWQTLLDVLKHLEINVACKVHLILPSSEKVMHSFISFPSSWVRIPFFWYYSSWIYHSVSP